MSVSDPNSATPEELKGARVVLNAARAAQPTGKVRDTMEKWLENMGTKLVEVRFWCRLGSSQGSAMGWLAENHVDDETTLMETVEMGMGRHGAKAAVYPCHGRWALRSKGTRYLDTQAQAEMLAMHNG